MIVKSIDTVWFVKELDKIKTIENIVIEYGHKITKGQIYLKGHDLESISHSKKNLRTNL